MTFKPVAALAALFLLQPAAKADTTAPPAFSVADVAVNENAGAAVVTVTKAPGKSGYSQVTLATVDGSAVAGVDYKRISLTLTFFSSNVSQRVSVPILDSKQTYQTRAFTVRLGTVHNATLARPEATVTITDNDAPVPTTQTCVDGAVIAASATCAWIPAPLRAGGFAIVKSLQPWDDYGPGEMQPLRVGQIAALYTNGWGVNFDGRISYALRVLPLTDMAGDGRAWAEDLAGVAPTGTPPTYPADWYLGWLATANQSCPDAYGRAGYPGVAAGTVYRSTLVVGSTYRPPAGQAGTAGVAVFTVPAADPYLGPLAVVMADCLTTN